MRKAISLHNLGGWQKVLLLQEENDQNGYQITTHLNIVMFEPNFHVMDQFSCLWLQVE